jgi:hypothetical protein
LQVPNLEKILPHEGREEEDSGGSSPSSFISASESEPRSSAGPGQSITPELDAAAAQQMQKAKVMLHGFDYYYFILNMQQAAKKKRAFGFFRRQMSMEKNLSQLAIGGGPASMGVADSSHSDENAPRSSHDNEEYESFGEDGAEDSAAEQGKKREGEEGGEEEGEEPEKKGSSGDYSNVYSDRFQNFLGEVRMLRELNHPNICLLMGTCFVAQGSKVRKLLLFFLLIYSCRASCCWCTS